LLRQIRKNLRTVFSSNPHLHLNIKTGKKLARPAGGPNAVQDYCEEQMWKNYPGIWSVLTWVVKNISESSRVTSCNSIDSTVILVHCVQPDGYEDIWPLLIPPMMTLLDDYQAEHKLEGVRIVSLMLHTIPQRTLLRTGVHELIFSVFFPFYHQM